MCAIYVSGIDIVSKAGRLHGDNLSAYTPDSSQARCVRIEQDILGWYHKALPGGY